MTVKINELKGEWWVIQVDMGKEDETMDKIKLYDVLLEIKEEVGSKKWVIMEDLHGHIDQNIEKVNVNGQMALDFMEKEVKIVKRSFKIL